MKVLDVFSKINQFSLKANQDLFVFIFGENMGNHLWRKFDTDYNRDVVRLYRNLDLDLQKTLSNYIEANF